jgi:hypothetical protein
MYFKLIAIFLISILNITYVSANQFQNTTPKSISNFETIYSNTDTGLDLQIIGNSLIKNKTLSKNSLQPLNVSTKIIKAFLLWSGETKNISDGKKITFIAANKKQYKLTADNYFYKEAAGYIYTAIADVTRKVKNNGLYGVTDFASEVLLTNTYPPYSVAGWSLIVITKNNKDKNSKQVIFKAGIATTYPGEIYQIEFDKEKNSSLNSIDKIAIIGGHARKGNGSSNAINGFSITGKEDWNGSSGTYWDIDLFNNLNNKNFHIKEKLTVQIDPLLQWLYPSAVIVQLKK